MPLLLSISLIIIAFLLGLFSQRLLFTLKRRLLRFTGPVVVPTGESASELYQKLKIGKELKPLPAPEGSTPEAVERWRKLGPAMQRQVLIARRQAGIDG